MENGIRTGFLTSTFLVLPLVWACGGEDADQAGGGGNSGGSSMGGAQSGSGGESAGAGGSEDGGTGGGTTGDGSGVGIVYIATPTGLMSLDLSDASSAQVGSLLPEYTNDRIAVSPDGKHIFMETSTDPVIIDSATGTNQVTDDSFFTAGVMGWIDNDSVLNDQVIRVGIRGIDGSEQAEYSLMGGGDASRWNLSPDGTKVALKESQTGRIKIFPTAGSVDFTDNISLTLDCNPPTWLADGNLVGVCINSQEFYTTQEGDTEVTRVPLDAPEYDVVGSTIWTGNDSILVHLKANGMGGAVGHRFVVIDSSGKQTSDVKWLGELPGSAGLLIRNIRLSSDDSMVIWSDQGPELWSANLDGSGVQEYDPEGALVLEFDWFGGK